jgi:hypothetical protein
MYMQFCCLNRTLRSVNFTTGPPILQINKVESTIKGDCIYLCCVANKITTVYTDVTELSSTGDRDSQNSTAQLRIGWTVSKEQRLALRSALQ